MKQIKTKVVNRPTGHQKGLHCLYGEMYDKLDAASKAGKSLLISLNGRNRPTLVSAAYQTYQRRGQRFRYEIRPNDCIVAWVEPALKRP